MSYHVYKFATLSNCGKLLRAFSTTLSCESLINTQGNNLGHSNNEKDWAIRSQAPKSVMIGYGEGSETKWMSAFVLHSGEAEA